MSIGGGLAQWPLAAHAAVDRADDNTGNRVTVERLHLSADHTRPAPIDGRAQSVAGTHIDDASRVQPRSLLEKHHGTTGGRSEPDATKIVCEIVQPQTAELRVQHRDIRTHPPLGQRRTVEPHVVRRLAMRGACNDRTSSPRAPDFGLRPLRIIVQLLDYR